MGLISDLNAMKDEVYKMKGEMQDDKRKVEEMRQRIKRYEDERPRKRSINDVAGVAEENSERKLKKRTVIEEF
jgi:hypothetical protein